MARVHSHEEAFDDRNAFLQVTLGVLSVCRQVSELVLVLGPASPRPADGQPTEDDRFLLAVLGVASLLCVAAEGIASAVPGGILPPTPVAPAEMPPPDLRSILA